MKNVTRLFLVLVVFVSFNSASSRAQSTTAPDYESLRANWVQKLESRDLAGSLALYASDATFTNPDGTHVSGASLRGLYKTVFESFSAKIVMTPRARAFSGSLGYEAGSYAEDLTKFANAERKHVTGDYLTVYRRTDSSGWLIVEQVWTEAAGK